jgi:hypothetical protein
MITAELASRISETLRILLDNGHDIVISHEVDNDLFSLYDLNYRINVKGQQALLRVAVAVLNNYLSSISCDGLLWDIDVHHHTQECLTFYASGFGHVVEAEDITTNAIARLTPQTSQAVFLKFIDDGREELFFHTGHLITKLIVSFGNLHYPALVWLKDDHNSWKSTTISPLELASRSIHTWDTLQGILDCAGISWFGFIEDALKMPDCKWCPHVLRAMSEIRWTNYGAAMRYKWPKFFKWLEAEVIVSRRTTLNQLFQWDEVVADLNQNKSLEYVERGILQRLDRFASRVAHHEDSETSDEDGDSESSDEDGNFLDEDEEVDLYQELQDWKARQRERSVELDDCLSHGNEG